jgi:hypothetical protein
VYRVPDEGEIPAAMPVSRVSAGKGLVENGIASWDFFVEGVYI